MGKYQKVFNRKSNRNRFSIECYIDGIFYPSLLSGCIDFEIGYPNVFNKLKNSCGSPIHVSGHVIVRKDWCDRHIEYDFYNDVYDEI